MRPLRPVVLVAIELLGFATEVAVVGLTRHIKGLLFEREIYRVLRLRQGGEDRQIAPLD